MNRSPPFAGRRKPHSPLPRRALREHQHGPTARVAEPPPAFVRVGGTAHGSDRVRWACRVCGWPRATDAGQDIDLCRWMSCPVPAAPRAASGRAGGRAGRGRVEQTKRAVPPWSRSFSKKGSLSRRPSPRLYFTTI